MVERKLWPPALDACLVWWVVVGNDVLHKPPSNTCLAAECGSLLLSTLPVGPCAPRLRLTPREHLCVREVPGVTQPPAALAP